MTDNEKRAHDLALTYVGALLASSGKENPKFFEEYYDMYDSFLSEIEKRLQK